MPADRLLIWDFDGTLAERTGAWSGTLADLMLRRQPDARVTAADFRPHLLSGFPWHVPEEIRAAPETPDEWWRKLEPVFASAFRLAGGLEDARARALAAEVRREYLRLDRWAAFPDVAAFFATPMAASCRHALLSNHAPELEDLLVALKLREPFEEVFNSARTGHEKPHPEAFRQVLRRFPGARPVMIGDSARADIEGARNCGIPAIRVRGGPARPGERHAADLHGLSALLEDEFA